MNSPPSPPTAPREPTADAPHAAANPVQPGAGELLPPSARTRWAILVVLMTLATLTTLALQASGAQAARPLVPSLILAVVLGLLALVDLKEFRLPDLGTLGLAALGLALWLPPLAGPSDRIPGDFFLHGGAALGAWALLAALAAFWQRWRGQEGLGLGDAKLLAAAGAWTGPVGLPFVLLIGAGSGLLTALILHLVSSRAPRHIAFGPHLALGFWVAWMTRLPQL